MLQALSGIIDAILSIVSFIQSFVDTLFGFFELIPQAVLFVSNLVQTLPPVLTVFATASIAVSVLFLIVGR